METREKSTSTPQLEEIITEDGILCSIISSLTLRDAVKTCVLSRRWRHIWSHLPNLIFDAENMLGSYIARSIDQYNNSLTSREKNKLLMGKTDQFIRYVCLVLQQHQGVKLEEFVVDFFLYKIHSHHLDAWIHFAVSLKTKKLNLDLHKPYFSNLEIQPYDFPCHMVESSSIEELSLVFCSLKPPHGFNGLKNLKVLLLYKVDVTEEDINLLLSNCFTLEELSVSKSRELVTLSIPHSLCQLHSLLVLDCAQLKKIEIDAINLISLDFLGDSVDFVFRQSSQLKEADIGFTTVDDLDCCLSKLSRSLPHLQSLRVCVRINEFSQVISLPKDSNRFIYLKLLDWVWPNDGKMSLHCLSMLLDVAPFMEEFNLKFTERTEENPPRRLRKLRKMTKSPHNHLKRVQLKGFYWDKWQIEIALYLFDNIIQLETMMIEKGDESGEEFGEEINKINKRNIKNLSREVPQTAKLVICNCPSIDDEDM